MIHSFNKSGVVVEGTDYFCSKDRSNIILLGDSLDDTNMAKDNSDTSNFIKIGYLFGDVGIILC